MGGFKVFVKARGIDAFTRSFTDIDNYCYSTESRPSHLKKVTLAFNLWTEIEDGMYCKAYEQLIADTNKKSPFGLPRSVQR